MERQQSSLERQAADVLRRARKLPVGPGRNDLRQLAVGLGWLHRNGHLKDISSLSQSASSRAEGLPLAEGASAETTENPLSRPAVEAGAQPHR
jgi:hypothetical protein